MVEQLLFLSTDSSPLTDAPDFRKRYMHISLDFIQYSAHQRLLNQSHKTEIEVLFAQTDRFTL
jgi:hypothetical protein